MRDREIRSLISMRRSLERLFQKGSFAGTVVGRD